MAVNQWRSNGQVVQCTRVPGGQRGPWQPEESNFLTKGVLRDHRQSSAQGPSQTLLRHCRQHKKMTFNFDNRPTYLILNIKFLLGSSNKYLKIFAENYSILMKSMFLN